MKMTSNLVAPFRIADDAPEQLLGPLRIDDEDLSVGIDTRLVSALGQVDCAVRVQRRT
jgi:hypothetical protein